jgi:hypothetical protein
MIMEYACTLTDHGVFGTDCIKRTVHGLFDWLLQELFNDVINLPFVFCILGNFIDIPSQKERSQYVLYRDLDIYSTNNLAVHSWIHRDNDYSVPC